MISIAATSLTQLIKKIAKEERESSKPCDIATGKVVSISPLKIKVSGKITLSGDFFISTETFSKKTLRTGDKLVMIRRAGGQGYLILDRVVM